MNPPMPLHTPVTISHASPTDFSSLAAILPQANGGNPIERFMFRPDAYKSSVSPSHKWGISQFRNGRRSHLTAEGPRTHLLKAVLKEAEEEAVGFAIIRVYGGENGHEESVVDGVDLDLKDGEGQENTDDVLNHEFCDEWVGRMSKIYKECTNGKNHACKCSLLQYVLSDQ